MASEPAQSGFELDWVWLVVQSWTGLRRVARSRVGTRRSDENVGGAHVTARRGERLRAPCGLWPLPAVLRLVERHHVFRDALQSRGRAGDRWLWRGRRVPPCRPPSRRPDIFRITFRTMVGRTSRRRNPPPRALVKRGPTRALARGSVVSRLGGGTGAVRGLQPPRRGDAQSPAGHRPWNSYPSNQARAIGVSTGGYPHLRSAPCSTNAVGQSLTEPRVGQALGSGLFPDVR